MPALTTRQAKGSKLTIQEMDDNLIYLESLSNEFTETIVNLSSAQILGLGGQIELLPAPGVDKYYVIDRIIVEYTFNTTAYVFPSSPAWYFDGCFDSYVDRTILTGATNSVCVITGNLRNTYQIGVGSGSTFVRTNKDVLNANLIIGTQNNDNPTTGNGTMRIKIYHKTATFGS